MRGESFVNELARLLLRSTTPRGPSESTQSQLERWLAAPSTRVLSRLVTRARGWKPRRGDGSKHMQRIATRLQGQGREVPDLASLLLEGAPTLDEQLEILDAVLKSGGYETAEALARELERAGQTSPRARQRLASVWCAVGEPQRAEAQTPTMHGAGPWRSGSNLHPYRASACLDEGRLDAEQLASFVGDHPLSLWRNPELELLLHNGGGPAREGLSALNRYLARLAVPSDVRARGLASDWLTDWEFSTPMTVRRGPLVSVIMAVRDAEETVGQAVDSILRQTHQPLELLVCDDGSSDRSLEILSARYGRDPRVRLFQSARNQGPYNVRNALLSRARGELVTFQDADDIALPVRLALQVAAALRPGQVASVANWIRVRPDGSVVFFWDDKAARLSIVSLMVRRESMQALGNYPSALFGADLDLYRRLLLEHGATRVARLPQPLVFGLWSAKSLTRSPLSESLESGYRSPARRRYSELLFRRDLFGAASLSSELMTRELRQMGNYLDPSPIREL